MYEFQVIQGHFLCMEINWFCHLCCLPFIVKYRNQKFFSHEKVTPNLKSYYSMCHSLNEPLWCRYALWNLKRIFITSQFLPLKDPNAKSAWCILLKVKNENWSFFLCYFYWFLLIGSNGKQVEYSLCPAPICRYLQRTVLNLLTFSFTASGMERDTKFWWFLLFWRPQLLRPLECVFHVVSHERQWERTGLCSLTFSSFCIYLVWHGIPRYLLQVNKPLYLLFFYVV